MPPHILVPLVAACLYALAAIVLKRATERGAGPWRVSFVTNWITACAFAPLWLLGGNPFAWSHLAHAFIASLAFFGGQVFTFLALSRGDVSVATPVLGTKVILVALLGILLADERPQPHWWGAIALTAAATALLGYGPRRPGANLRASLAYGFGAASFFALTDVLQQKWAPLWGFGRFTPVMFLMVAMLSFALLPLFRSPLRSLDRTTWRFLIPGALLLACQAAAVAYSIVALGGATLVNILYSSRGLWTVVIVWTAGHWFGNTERQQGGGVMGARLAGAALLIVAIAVVLR